LIITVSTSFCVDVASVEPDEVVVDEVFELVGAVVPAVESVAAAPAPSHSSEYMVAL